LILVRMPRRRARDRAACAPPNRWRARCCGLQVFAIRVAVTSIFSRTSQSRAALDPVDLVLLHQELDALGCLETIWFLRSLTRGKSRRGLSHECRLSRRSRKRSRHPRRGETPWQGCSQHAGKFRQPGSFSTIAVFSPYCPAVPPPSIHRVRSR